MSNQSHSTQTLEETLTNVRGRIPKFLSEVALPELLDGNGTPLSSKARTGLINLLKQEKPDQLNTTLHQIRPQLDGASCATLLSAIEAEFEKTQPSSARRWVLFATGWLGDHTALHTLGRRVEIEHNNKKHAFSLYCLQALHRSRSPIAMGWLDHWARKGPSLRIRKNAWIHRSELARLIGERPLLAVERLGFDPHGHRDLPYGSRTVRLSLNHENKILLSENGRTLKSPPRARKVDDPETVKQARDTIRQCKQDLKLEEARLESALESAMVRQQSWTLPQWSTLFLGHPITWVAGRGLVFEQNGEQRFILSEEGDVLDQDANTLSLKEGASLRLAHPLLMKQSELDAFKQLLELARARQPFDQLNRAVFDTESSIVSLLQHALSQPSWRFLHAIKSAGYLPVARNMSEISIRYVGPWQLNLHHLPCATFAGRWAPNQSPAGVKITGLTVHNRGKVIPTSALPPVLRSEVIRDVMALRGQ